MHSLAISKPAPTPRMCTGAISQHLQYLQSADSALRKGWVGTAIDSLEGGLAAGGGSLGDETETRAAYAKLISVSRRSCGPEVAPRLLRHLRERAGVEPDASLTHMVVGDAVYRGKCGQALDVLRDARAAGAPLSSGSFDAIIQAAGRARDVDTAATAYRLLRRSRIAPTSLTLNALMNVRSRCGDPKGCIALLRRAQAGAPRWPGEPPDAWSWITAMSCASRAGEYRMVRQLSVQLHCTEGVAPTTAAFNVAIDACFKEGKVSTAQLLYRRMRERRGDAPPLMVDTFNTMLTGLHRANLPTGPLMQDMAAAAVQPDAFTLCTLLRMQRSLQAARRVWYWGRNSGVARGQQAWHHMAECVSSNQTLRRPQGGVAAARLSRPSPPLPCTIPLPPLPHA